MLLRDIAPMLRAHPNAAFLGALLCGALTVSVLAPAGTAAADDCMCVAMPTGRAVRVSRLEQSLLESNELGPFFSSDGSSLSSSQLERITQHFEREARRPIGEVLWCWSPSDPRCAPGDPAPEEAPRASRTAPSLAVLPDRAARWREVWTDTELRAPPEDDRPREGVRARVERPPRA